MENALAAEVPAESAPAPQTGAVTNPDGLEKQAGASPEGEVEQPKEADKTGTPKGVQKRLDELTRQRGEAQRMNERLLGVLERTLSGGKAPEAVESGPPKRETFQTMEAYLEAKADFQVAEAVKNIERKTAEARQAEAQQQREATWTQKLKDASKQFDDFEEVAMADDLPISPHMAMAMKDSDNGPAIAYHLGKNPADAQRISQLSPAAQVREIGKIEARLEVGKAAPAKSASKAPAPIDPVGAGKGSVGGGNLDAMSQKDYEAQRSKDSRYYGARPR